MFSAQQVLASLILDRNDIVSDLEKIGTDFQSLDRDKFTLEKP
jgi:hypothetical protein